MENTKPTKKSKLTLYIIIALVIGIGLGFALNKSYVSEENKKLETLELHLQKIQKIIEEPFWQCTH